MQLTLQGYRIGAQIGLGPGWEAYRVEAPSGSSLPRIRLGGGPSQNNATHPAYAVINTHEQSPAPDCDDLNRRWRVAADLRAVPFACEFNWVTNASRRHLAGTVTPKPMKDLLRPPQAHELFRLLGIGCIEIHRNILPLPRLLVSADLHQPTSHQIAAMGSVNRCSLQVERGGYRFANETACDVRFGVVAREVAEYLDTYTLLSDRLWDVVSREVPVHGCWIASDVVSDPNREALLMIAGKEGMASVVAVLPAASTTFGFVEGQIIARGWRRRTEAWITWGWPPKAVAGKVRLRVRSWYRNRLQDIKPEVLFDDWVARTTYDTAVGWPIQMDKKPIRLEAAVSLNGSRHEPASMVCLNAGGRG